jgi:hypothetical protein
MLWDTLILDVVWWVIRYMDITHLGEVMFALKFLRWDWVVTYPQVNEYDLGNGLRWHVRTDWDNAPIYLVRYAKERGLYLEKWKPPLVFGCYWWWSVFAALLAGLGAYLIWLVFL